MNDLGSKILVFFMDGRLWRVIAHEGLSVASIGRNLPKLIKVLRFQSLCCYFYSLKFKICYQYAVSF